MIFKCAGGKCFGIAWALISWVIEVFIGLLGNRLSVIFWCLQHCNQKNRRIVKRNGKNLIGSIIQIGILSVEIPIHHFQLFTSLEIHDLIRLSFWALIQFNMNVESLVLITGPVLIVYHSGDRTQRQNSHVSSVIFVLLTARCITCNALITNSYTQLYMLWSCIVLSYIVVPQFILRYSCHIWLCGRCLSRHRKGLWQCLFGHPVCCIRFIRRQPLLV